MGLTQGVRIPAAGNNMYVRDYRRDKDGNFVITRLNEQMLQEIANAGNGKYYRASSPDIGLNSIIDDLNKLNKDGSGYTEYSEYDERFQDVIWVVLALLVLEFLLLGRKNKWLRNIRIFENGKQEQ